MKKDNLDAIESVGDLFVVRDWKSAMTLEADKKIIKNLYIYIYIYIGFVHIFP